MFTGIIARLRSLWDGIRRRPQVEADMDDEFRLHMEFRAQDLARQGLSPAQAARQARLEFGITEELKDENPIGRRIRYVASESRRVASESEEPGPWFEIIGVAKDLGTTNGYGRKGVYHPVYPGSEYPAYLTMHVRGDPRSFATQLRSVAATVDPTLRLYDVTPLDAVADAELKFYSFWFRLTVAVSGVALLLSLSGIYSVMAFVVSRRTREIGIRVALGSDQRRILFAVFRRPLIQVSLGVAAGAVVITLLLAAGSGGLPSLLQLGVTVAYAILVLLVCLLACLVPTRRALRIQPTEALRSEG